MDAPGPRTRGVAPHDMISAPVPLDEAVDFCCVEDAPELELLALDTTGGLVIPPNWARIAPERITTTTTMMTKVSHLLAGLVVMPARTQSARAVALI